MNNRDIHGSSQPAGRVGSGRIRSQILEIYFCLLNNLILLCTNITKRDNYMTEFAMHTSRACRVCKTLRFQM